MTTVEVSIRDKIGAARRGESKYHDDILAYLRHFKRLVLRGGGNFGREFAGSLLALNLDRDALVFWDVRAEALGEIHGIPVAQPFSQDYDRDGTLIINCIPNGSLSGSVGEADFSARGYSHYLSGMALFEALLCSMSRETGFDASVCLNTTFCNWCSCKRLISLLQNDCAPAANSPARAPLTLGVASFVLNQKCTLQCTHCGQYINHYRSEERINFPLARVTTDIDRMFSAVDAIGYVSLIGGEPFLHPQLTDIVDHILHKPNFGVIGITTNGICEMSEATLQRLKNGKTRIIFSDYTGALDEKQRRLFALNVQKVAAAGIHHTVGQPLWSTPEPLLPRALPDDAVRALKQSCHSTDTCKTIQNGVYYPCTTTAGIGSHHLADLTTDWVRIDETHSADELRQRIQALDAAPWFESCRRCGSDSVLLRQPGEQGVGQRYIHIGQR
ncbi:4Fe-4S cluster-binding domain-containing protein [Rhodocyclus tenuis]|uniref:radical SAM protein n=1 Tax=Rhodocyclus gracilis TaxID=2929842 RepID=UPI001298C388|nr:radical SAM protein [Rhodocyclus gracilis]MRD73050.1 4Fe-4S cluster-binding domain-containing protein [Rhodocyclus gracilis]